MINSEDPIPLTPSEQGFIQHLGEMGSRWGINRTVGQMYALLFIHEHPLNSDQLASTLNLSRSNVSMGIKELQAWNLLHTHHQPGDRKTYYSTPEDMWEIARTLFTEKRKREIDPTLSMLRNQLMHENESPLPEYASKRIHEMHDLIEMVIGWTHEMQTIPTSRIKQLLKLGSKINKVLDLPKNVKKKK